MDCLKMQRARQLLGAGPRTPAMAGGPRDGGRKGNWRLGEAAQQPQHKERSSWKTRGWRRISGGADFYSECGRGAKERGNIELSVVTNSPLLLRIDTLFLSFPSKMASGHLRRPAVGQAALCSDGANPPLFLSPRSGFFHLFPSARLLTRRSGRTAGHVHVCKYSQHWLTRERLAKARAQRDQLPSIYLIPTDDRAASPTGTSRRGRK